MALRLARPVHSLLSVQRVGVTAWRGAASAVPPASRAPSLLQDGFAYVPPALASWTRAQRLLLYSGVGVATAVSVDPTSRRTLTRSAVTAYRFVKTAAVFALISADYKYSMGSLTGEARRAARRQAHARSAKRMLTLFKSNGGIYIKAGQHVASLDHILPPEYTKTMAVLQDRAPTQTWDEVEQVFLEDFGVLPDQVFARFDRTPIAAASLAQVHRASLADGHEVAVKVQYHGLREKCVGDTNTIQFLVSVAEWMFPDLRLQWLVNEFHANLPKELDFIQEARNAERVASHFSDDSSVYVPGIYWDLTSSRILCMEFIHGCRVDDLVGLNLLGVSTHRVVDILTRCFSQQIFIDGFVHCDPHPGNILVRLAPPSSSSSSLRAKQRQPQLVLLDHGLYRELTPQFRLDYAHLWRALILQDEVTARRYAARLTSGRSFEVFASILTARAYASTGRDLSSKMSPEEQKHLQQALGSMFAEIMDVLAALPPELYLLLKCNDLLRALNRSLDSHVDPYRIQAEYCMRALAQHHRPSLASAPSLGQRLRQLWLRLQVRVRLMLWSLSLRWAAVCAWFTGSSTAMDTDGAADDDQQLICDPIACGDEASPVIPRPVAMAS